MTQLAHIIPFEQEALSVSKRSGGFTRLDNATDLLQLAQLPNALLKPYLFLLSRRELRQPGVRWAEVAEFAGRSQTQTSDALRNLSQLGLAFRARGLWFSESEAAARYRKPGSEIPETRYLEPGATGPRYRKPGIQVPETRYKSTGNPVFTIQKMPSQSVLSWPLKEEERRRKKNNNSVPELPVQPDHRAEDAVGEINIPTALTVKVPQTPEAGQSGNTTGRQDLPARAALQVALRTLGTAGLLDVWADWVRLNTMAQVTQEIQAPQWAAWVDAGHAGLLRREAADIVASGSFAHPWGGLKARMGRADAAALAQQQAAAAFGPPQVQPGDRRRAPDGRVWTVEYVEYGIVTFEELGAPVDLGDAIVARWPLEVTA